VDRIRALIVKGHTALHLCLRDGLDASRCADCTCRPSCATAQEVAGLKVGHGAEGSRAIAALRAKDERLLRLRGHVSLGERDSALRG
jgi:hypothetical protein